MDVGKSFGSIRDSIKEGDLSAAKKEIDSVVESNPADVNIILKCALFMLIIGDEQNYRSLLEKAVAALPPNSVIDYESALSSAGLDNNEEALGLISKLKGDMESISGNQGLSAEPSKKSKRLSFIGDLSICDMICSFGDIIISTLTLLF